MKKTSIVKIVICLLSLALICIGLSACKEQTYTVTLNYDKKQGTVTVSPTSDDGVYAEGTELTVTVTPVDGYAVESFKLGSEEKVGELNIEGKFVFKVQQDTTITVTFKSTTVAVESVSLNKQSLSVHVTKQDDTLTAQVLPENATDKTVTWTSSVPEVATVDTNGKITAVAAGDTFITATAGDGKTATCTVTVTDHELTTVSAGESGHKSVCGVEGCGYESAVTAHSLTINSDKTKFECEQCDYEVEHTHDIKVESAGENGHKDVCQTEGCGYESAVTAHSLKINSAKDKFQCEQCDYEVAHTHKLETKSAGESGHKSVCQTEGCGYESEVTAHSLKINSAKDKFECEQCDYEVAHTHDIKVVSAGESGHKSVCQTEGCGYESAVTAHSMKINSAKDKFQCEQCDYEVEHNHDIKVESAGANGHKDVCQTEGCGYESEVKSHNLDPEYTPDGNKGHHTNCLDCDYVTETEPHHHAEGEPFDVERNSYGQFTNQGLHYHDYRCTVCEARVSEEHKMEFDCSDPETERWYCTICQTAISTWTHNFVLVADDDGYHHQECTNFHGGSNYCTYKTESVKCEESGEAIVYTADSDAPASGHRGTCPCGNELALEAHDQDGPSDTCKKCGYSGTHTHKDEPDANGYKDGLCDIDGLQLTDPIWTIGADGIITAFKGDETYTKLIVPTTIDGITVKSVGKTTLQYNKNLTHIIVPSGIEAATGTNQTFKGCSNLQSVIILGLPTAANIGTNAFRECNSLKEIVLPENVTGFHQYAFGSSPAVSLNITIYFMGTNEQWNKILPASGTAALKVIQEQSTVLFFGADDSGWHWQIDNVVPMAGKNNN